MNPLSQTLCSFNKKKRKEKLNVVIDDLRVSSTLPYNVIPHN